MRLADLNPSQRRAAEALEGPVLVLAGAGTGKTKVLTTRLALLLSKKVEPESILAVTFTNKAAREMRDRATALAGAEAKKVWLSTFHSLCVRILRREIKALGWRPDFTIYDESDQESVIRGVLKTLSTGVALTPDQLRWRFSSAKNRGLSPAAEGDEEGAAAAVLMDQYDSALKARNAVDFDDLLLLTLRLFRTKPDVLKKYRKQFRYVMVDEYQDTNRIQYDIVRELSGERQNLFVVGDDDQSIYAWRGADPSHILRFETDFSGATVVRLEQNYRSTTAILDCANTLISKNASRHKKTLFSKLGAGAPVKSVLLPHERAEAEWVVGRIRESRQRGRRWADHAVLLRTNDQSRPFEEQLRLARVPYTVVGGQRFYDRREVRDVVAYLRLAANPSDDAALARVANVPPRGLGDTSLERLGTFASEKKLPLFEAFRRAGEAGVPKASGGSCGRLVGLIEKTRELMKTDAAHAARELVEALDLRGELRREGASDEAAEARVSAVDGVLEDVRAYTAGGGTLESWIEKITLQERDEPGSAEKDAVVLLTAHAAKGLEFPMVFVSGLEDGVFPHRRSAATETGLEEERRLFYVAMTRAKQELVLTMPEKRTRRGQEVACLPSRFLAELPAGVVREAPGKREITAAEMEDTERKIQEILARGAAGAPSRGPG